MPEIKPSGRQSTKGALVDSHHHCVVIESVYLLALIFAFVVVIVILFRTAITSKDQQLKLSLEIKNLAIAGGESLKDSYSRIATEAVDLTTNTVNHFRQKEGKDPLVIMVPVIPESGPFLSTIRQRDVANVQTLRARMAALQLALGNLPREEPIHEIEDVLGRAGGD